MNATLEVPADRTPAGVKPPFERVLDLLASERIPVWVIDDGSAGAPGRPRHDDIDCVVPREAVGRLPELLRRAESETGGRLIKWNAPFPLRRLPHAVLAFHDPAAASADAGAGEPPRYLNFHFRPAFHRAGRYFYPADRLLRRAGAKNGHAGPAAAATAAPAPAVEFCCRLIEHAARGALPPAGERERLAEAYRRDPEACSLEVQRFWGDALGERILTAAASGRWDGLQEHLPALRKDVRRRAALRRPLWTLGYLGAKALRRLARPFRPTQGVHLVLLGPDGAGKTTVIEGVSRDLARAFGGRTVLRTPAPALLRKQGLERGNPHGKAPHTLVGSCLQAAYWLAYYGVAYAWKTYPLLRRPSLVLGHRYVIDAVVDPRRYRYAGPAWLIWAVWRVIPKPDVIVLLDAPAEVIHARKQELPRDELARQRAAYRALARRLGGVHVVDASRPARSVVAEVDAIVFRFMAERTARRLGLGGRR